MSLRMLNKIKPNFAVANFNLKINSYGIIPKLFEEASKFIFENNSQ